MSEKKPKLLIVDDDRIVCRSLQLLFNINGFEAQYLINPHNIIEFIGNFHPELLILDLNFSLETSGDEGLVILHKVRENYPDLPVILLTAWGNVELAVKAMKAGAVDFLTKPWKNENILDAVKTQLNLRVEEQKVTTNILEQWPGNSAQVQAQKSLMMKAANSNLPVLISGDKGTGHQEVVNIIHQLSERKNKPLIRLVSDENLNLNLLGYRRGAVKGKEDERIGELAHTGGGVLWIEQIEKLNNESQTLLLKIIQNEKYQPIGALIDFDWKGRIITTTSFANPKSKLIDELWYKLNILHIRLPSLSEIRGDIPSVINRKLDLFNTKNNKSIRIEPSALEWLSVRDYPGNRTELKFIIDKACVLADNNLIRIKLLKEIAADTVAEPKQAATMMSVEAELIRKTLEEKKGNVSEAAKKLGLSRSALYRRMAKFDLNKTE